MIYQFEWIAELRPRSPTSARSGRRCSRSTAPTIRSTRRSSASWSARSRASARPLRAAADQRTRGHGTHTLPAIWGPYLQQLLAASGGDRLGPLDLGVTLRFLRKLKQNNDRAWFHANRAAWDAHVRHGWEDLVTMLLLAGARPTTGWAHVDPRACVFRLANDTRFHHGRTPYKTPPRGLASRRAARTVRSPATTSTSRRATRTSRPASRAGEAGAARAALDVRSGRCRARAFDRLLASKGLRAVPAAGHRAAARHAARLRARSSADAT